MTYYERVLPVGGRLVPTVRQYVYPDLVRGPRMIGFRRCGREKFMGELLTPTHLIVVLVVALLIFGPKKLPDLGKGLGEGLRGFKDAIKGTPEAAKQDVPPPPKEIPTEVK